MIPDDPRTVEASGRGNTSKCVNVDVLIKNQEGAFCLRALRRARLLYDIKIMR
jgi:hypothetical protein